MQVLPAAQPGLTYATTIEDQREVSLNYLGAQLESDVSDAGQRAGAIIDDATASRVVAMPAEEAVALGLDNPGLSWPLIERLQHLSEGYPLSATISAGTSALAAASTAAKCRAALSRVSGRGAVSPRSAGCISAATTALVSRSIACSGL